MSRDRPWWSANLFLHRRRSGPGVDLLTAPELGVSADDARDIAAYPYTRP